MDSKQISFSMDIDWACDEVIADSVDLFTQMNVPVTIFVTHSSDILANLRANPLISFGIHPNLLPQLQGQSNTSYLQTIEELLALIPEAKIGRCHALVDATPILMYFKHLGLKMDSNLFIPFSSGIPLRTFQHFSGLTRVPYFYEDDAYCFEAQPRSPEDHVLRSEGLRIFNFHPIHLFLNTEKMARYHEAKAFYHDFQGLKPFINPDETNGAKAFLRRVVHCAKENNFTFTKMEEL